MDRFRVCLRVPLLVAGLLVLGGCNLTDTDPPSSAHYTLTSDKPVQLITSIQFAVGGTDVTLFEADTVTVSTKDEVVSLPSQPRFFIRAIPLSSTTSIKLKVDVGDRNWYDASRTVSPPDKLEFIYGYTGTTNF